MRKLSDPFHRRRTLAGIGFCGLAGLLVFHFAFCNVPRHSAEWTARQLDDAIARGLDYLHGSAAFARPLAEGGESAMHHYLLGLVLARQDHPALRAQMAVARQANEFATGWRFFFGLPGWPREELTEEDRQSIRSCIAKPDNRYGAWILHSLNPDSTELPAEESHALFEDPAQLRGSYDLTHALISYHFIAGSRNVAPLIERTNRRLRRIQAWSPRCGDSAIERIALWSILQPPHPVPRRALERILNNQNADGGWSEKPGWGRTLQEAVGWNPRDAVSQPHPTFLALLALTCCRDQLRVRSD